MLRGSHLNWDRDRTEIPEPPIGLSYEVSEEIALI